MVILMVDASLEKADCKAMIAGTPAPLVRTMGYPNPV